MLSAEIVITLSRVFTTKRGKVVFWDDVSFVNGILYFLEKLFFRFSSSSRTKMGKHGIFS